MSRFDPTLIVIIVAVVLCIFFIRFLFRPKGPPTATFKCARCGIIARHTQRTVDAWRRKANRLYCETCHRKWLETQPRQGGATAPDGSRRGCLGVLFLIACVPLAVLAFAWYAFGQPDAPVHSFILASVGTARGHLQRGVTGRTAALVPTREHSEGVR